MVRERSSPLRERRQLESILLVFVLVVTGIVVVFPLTAPEVRGQVVHLASASAEDNAGAPYDIGPVGDGVVIWNPDEDHIISNPAGYTIEEDMTLNIPPMNYFFGDPADPNEHEITFLGYGRIDVNGTLITNTDGPMELTYTAFLGGGLAGWDGIYFHAGSQGRINDAIIKNAYNGLVFEPGSIPSGVSKTNFEDIGAYGIRMDGAITTPSITDVTFYDQEAPSATCIEVANGDLNIRRTVFVSHGPDLQSLHIYNASVSVIESWFNVKNQTGNSVLIEGNSNNTVIDRCGFLNGAVGDYYIQVDGSSPIITNCKFKTLDGARSVIANDDGVGIPAHPVLLNPTSKGPPGDWTNTFDNSSMNATGDSSITLKWYMDVYVDNPNGDPKGNTPVWVKDRNGNPAEPSFKLTEDDVPEPLDYGWARGFVVTELIKSEGSVENFNPFNVTAEDFPPKGYADPEPTMNMSKEVYVTVPFDPDNVLPIVTWITTPVGIQSGLITIHYRLEDPNPGENGSLSVQVYYSTEGMKWYLAEQGGGHSLTGLYNNTVYTFVWNSNTESGISNQHNTTVYIKIVPYDEHGEGIANQTGNFTVDNKGPVLTLPPFVTVGNEWTLIEWAVNEPANAKVRYGLFVNGGLDDLTAQQSGSVLSNAQSVNLTGLLPGRKYTFIMYSTDIHGNTGSSYPAFPPFTFITEVYIALYEGWNMISVPPFLPSLDLEAVLASITGDGIVVQTYLAGEPDDPWKQHVAGKPFGNDLDWIFPEMGLWILMNNDSTLIPDQILPDPESPPYVVLLLEGWNFVGYPSAQTRTVANALSGINYSVVMTYDAATGDWLRYDGPGGDLDSLTHMEMGRGYWIYSTEPMEQEWSLPYAD